MKFRIADTFTDSLARLTGEQQKAVKTTAFDVQLNPARAWHAVAPLDQAKHPHFWSVRVSRDMRLIVHKTDASLLLCYVDRHDEAYRWAERRKLETHPNRCGTAGGDSRDGAGNHRPYLRDGCTARPTQSMLVRARRRGGTPELRRAGRVAARRAPSQRRHPAQLADHLPSEAAEALLELATGGKPPVVQPVAAVTDPFEHPDAQRRFRVMNKIEELARALDYPWEKWTIFLHPAQRQWVEGDYSGPARVSGSAGTGKTIVALHRAVFLARTSPDARVLLTTFSDMLANALRTRLSRLISHELRLGERLEVHAMNAISRRLYESHFSRPKIASREVIQSLLADAARGASRVRSSASIFY